MHYWNRDNFEGLAELAEQLHRDPRLHDLARYCELREAGRRSDALEALDRFLTAALSSTVEVQRELVLLVLGAHGRIAEAHQFLSHPLRQRLLEPVLEAWCAAEPHNATPIGELGLLHRNADLLERALELNTSDDRVRACLVSILVGQVEYATHHLGEGKLIGTFEVACATLGRAERLIETASNPGSMTGLAAEVAEHRDLLDDWNHYRQDPLGTFPEWCRERGKAHRWWSIVYYRS